jgi:hypothetical protein
MPVQFSFKYMRLQVIEVGVSFFTHPHAESMLGQDRNSLHH